MKRKTINLMTMAVLAVSLLVQGCEQPNIVPDLPGTTIKFKAATTWDNGIKTKTVYSGEIIGTTDKKERIDWLAGDKIRIYSDKASFYYDATVHYADYSVDAGSISEQGASSFATITPAGDLDGGATNASSANGLVWGDGTHKFFSVYPSPAVTDGNLELYSSGTDSRTFEASIPNEVVFKASDVVDGVLKPDMNYAYMYAMAQAEPGNAVTLKYQPMFSAFQFTLDSGDDEELTFLDFYIKSAVDDNTEVPAGSYKATLTMPDDPEQAKISYSFGTATDDTQKRIHVKFGENGEGIKITRGHPLTFTVLARPVDYTQLTIIVATLNGDGTRTKKLELKDPDGNWVTFDSGHKFNFKFGVPGEWIYYIDDPEPVTLTYEGGGAALHGSNQFKSYRARSGQSEPVEYKLQYSTYDDETGTWSSWTDGLPGWLSADSPSNYEGSVSGEALKLEMDPQDNTAEDPHGDNLKEKGTAAGIIDLSTINVATGATVATTTANCYVVQQAGTYKFPVVYGNGLEDGEINTSAYTAAYTGDRGNFLKGTFPNYQDNHIQSPYILTDLNVSSGVDAMLLWMDEPGLVKDIQLTGSGDNAYIKFVVPQDSIRQGNAVIALTVNGTIAWSWHIWVTDHDMTTHVKAPSGYSFPLYNLGWCDGRELKKYLERKCRIRAVQLDEHGDEFGSQDHESDPAVVLQEAYRTIVRDNNPYYQWGRKDPLGASSGLPSTTTLHYLTKDLAYFDHAHPVDVANNKGDWSIGDGIKNPHKRFLHKFPSGTTYEWTSSGVINRWNSGLTTAYKDGVFGAIVTKTIYDPSPVGFKVGPAAAFLGFDSSNLSWQDGTELTIARLTYKGTELCFPQPGFRRQDEGETTVIAIDDAGLYSTASAYEQKVKYFESRTNRVWGIDMHNEGILYHRAASLPIRAVVDDAFSKGIEANGENAMWE